MELKDPAVALIGIIVVLLALGLFTNGIAFYAAALAALIALAADLFRYELQLRDLRRNLTVTRSVSGRELLLGSMTTVSYDLDYQGKRQIPLRCSQPAAPTVAVDGSPVDITLAPGSQTIAFTLKPVKRGEHALYSLRMAVESYLFRGALTAGGESAVNAYLLMGQAGAGRGRLRRVSLPGSEASRRGAGSDFSYVRDFMPGDNTRNIDWGRSSRSPQLVVRTFEDERTLPLFVLIDVDASMGTGKAKTELESAVDLASALASQVLLDNERVGIACFSRSDVASFLPAAGGKGQMALVRETLSSIEAVAGGPPPREGLPTLHEAEAARRTFGEMIPGSAISSVMEETMRQFTANVREDGFIKAVARASQSVGTPCIMIVISNLSMGVASLLSGVRIATYYGHTVSVALTPHVWYEDAGEGTDPEKCYDRYRQAKDLISRLRGHRITVIELSAGEKPETILHQGRARVRAGTLRQR